MTEMQDLMRAAADRCEHERTNNIAVQGTLSHAAAVLRAAAAAMEPPPWLSTGVPHPIDVAPLRELINITETMTGRPVTSVRLNPFQWPEATTVLGLPVTRDEAVRSYTVSTSETSADEVPAAADPAVAHLDAPPPT